LKRKMRVSSIKNVNQTSTHIISAGITARRILFFSQLSVFIDASSIDAKLNKKNRFPPEFNQKSKKKQEEKNEFIICRINGN